MLLTRKVVCVCAHACVLRERRGYFYTDSCDYLCGKRSDVWSIILQRIQNYWQTRKCLRLILLCNTEIRIGLSVKYIEQDQDMRKKKILISIVFLLCTVTNSLVTCLSLRAFSAKVTFQIVSPNESLFLSRTEHENRNYWPPANKKE